MPKAMLSRPSTMNYVRCLGWVRVGPSRSPLDGRLSQVSDAVHFSANTEGQRDLLDAQSCVFFSDASGDVEDPATLAVELALGTRFTAWRTLLGDAVPAHRGCMTTWPIRSRRTAAGEGWPASPSRSAMEVDERPGE